MRFEELLIDPIIHDADQLFISHADQPADAPAAGCDTIDEQTIFDLNEEEEPEEEEDDEGAAAPSSSSVAGAAIKHKRTVDKFLALRIVYGEGTPREPRRQCLRRNPPDGRIQREARLRSSGTTHTSG